MEDMDKQYGISEVAEITGYPPHVLRYYEKEFELDIPRNESNHRYYTYAEIELFQYIKSLQDKGFSNKQIKLIIKSPEVLVNSNDETALTSINQLDSTNMVELAQEISLKLYDKLLDGLHEMFENNKEYNDKLIKELMDEIAALRNEINSKERDVLICENAKLKMKIKEKSYEVAELKEKIKRLESNKSIIKKLFRRNKWSIKVASTNLQLLLIFA